MAKGKTTVAVWLRRASQTVFLLLFLFLFYQLTYHPGNETQGPTGLFFNLDPVVMMTMWLSGHAVAAALLLSFVTLLVSLLFGRWFCGWVCPLGTLNNIFSSGNNGKKKEKIKGARYTPGQRLKYYLLVMILAGALFGFNMAGWLDPFSILYRSFATAVFPAVNALGQGLFDWFYDVNPLGLRAVSEPVYRLMGRYFLTLGQPHYDWGMLFGVLFGVILAVNFFKARFWCRYLCPLGGMLGLVGKNPTLVLSVDSEKCKNCLECTAVCQGGAEPQSSESWRAAECVYCWSCQSQCPENAISFQFKTPGVTS